MPSVLLPLFLELFRTAFPLSDWTLIVSALEILGSLRLIAEGAIFPPLRVLLTTIDHAAPQVVMFFLVLCPMIFLTAVVHSQLFSLFDPG